MIKVGDMISDVYDSQVFICVAIGDSTLVRKIWPQSYCKTRENAIVFWPVGCTGYLSIACVRAIDGKCIETVLV